MFYNLRNIEQEVFNYNMAHIVEKYVEGEYGTYGPYYVLRNGQGKYVDTVGKTSNYFKIRSALSSEDIDKDDALDSLEANGVELAEQYLEYVDDYEDEIKPLNEKHFEVNEMKILKDDVRQDLYRNVFDAKGIDYKYAETIFDLVEKSKADSSPDEYITRLESIIGYANDFEPDTRTGEVIDRDEFDEELFDAMNLISEINYGVITELYGENPEVHRMNHSYSEAKILNKFLNDQDDKITYNDNTSLNYSISPDVLDVFSKYGGDTTTTIELTEDNLLYSPDITMPVDLNRNELEVNVIGDNLTVNASNVSFKGERLSDKVDYEGLNKNEETEFIREAAKKIVGADNLLSEEENKQFVSNLVKFESETRDTVNAKTIIESMYVSHPEDYQKDAVNALKPPRFDSIQVNDEVKVNGEDYTVIEKYTDFGEENSLELESEDDFKIVNYMNGVSLDDLGNPVNISTD